MIKLKALCINASARKDGNCAKLLRQAAMGLKAQGINTRTIFLDGINIQPWRENITRDDMGSLESLIRKSDIIILASPIYFGSLSAQAKIMIDRCQGFWETKHILKKNIRKQKAKAAFICVQASDSKKFFNNAAQISRYFFTTIEAEYKAELLLGNLENKTDIQKHPQLLKKAYNLGKTLARYC